MLPSVFGIPSAVVPFPSTGAECTLWRIAGDLIDDGIIIAINSLLASKLPAPYDHVNKLNHAAIDIFTHYRTAD